MKNTSFFIAAVYTILLVSCCNENPQPSQMHPANTEKTATAITPPIWALLCSTGDFKALFDCHQENCYQVELLCDPFKDLVIITLDIGDSLTDMIHYNRFAFNTSGKNADGIATTFPVVNPVTKDTIWCSPIGHKSFKVGKQRDLNHFFSNVIWDLPSEDKGPGLDAESWRVKGRKTGQEVSIVRWNFSDSLYYSHIQKLLDLCRVTDYHYPKR